MGTVDIGLIKDETSVEAPRSWPRIEVPPLSENLVEMVELAQGVDPATSDPADTTPADSTLAISRTPQLILIHTAIYSSCFLMRVKNLKAQMATYSTT